MLNLDRTILGAMIGSLLGFIVGNFIFSQNAYSIYVIIFGIAGAVIFRYIWRY